MISWDVVFMYCQPLLVTLSSAAKARKRSSLVRLDQAIVSCHMRDILSYSYMRGTACIMMSQGPYIRYCLSSSLVPRLSRNAKMYRGESLVSFLRKHDVIKIGLKQKGNVLRVVQPTMLQHSVCMIFDAR